MRVRLFLSGCLASCVSATAQPTITNMENYMPGHQIETIVCDSLGLSAGPAGAGQVWDFSGLKAKDSISSTIMSVVGGVPLPANKLAKRNAHAGNGTVEFVYYHKTNTETDLLYTLDSNSNTGAPKYPDSMLIGLRPFMYTTTAFDTFTTDYTWIFFTPPYHHYTGAGSVNVMADGWGTLILPNDTYQNVLRVKSYYVQNDTGVTAGFNALPVSERWVYRWYNNNFASPLLTIDSAHLYIPTAQYNTEKVSYTKSEILLPTGISNTAKINNISAAIKNDKLLIRGLSADGVHYELTLFNLNGQKIYNTGFYNDTKQQYFDMDTEPIAGIYFLSLHDLRSKNSHQIIKLLKD